MSRRSGEEAVAAEIEKLGPAWRVLHAVPVGERGSDGAVIVVPRKRISQFLRKLPLRLRAREIEAIYEVAGRSTTWR